MERIFFTSVHVAGFKYYNGAFLFPKMRVGSRVELRLDPDNIHDEYAVEIRFDGARIGYIPRDENKAIATLLRAGYDIFDGVIQRISPDSHPEQQIEVGIFLRVRKSAPVSGNTEKAES